MVGHRFSDRLKFWSEVEVEHAFVEVEGGEETGEVAIEQAYLDLMVHRRFNLRAGMVLVPVGIINERHEPPTFNGVERTMVDTVIVPTTWRDIGIGAFGDLGRGFSYRAYAVPGLDATGFSAEEGHCRRTAAGRPGRCERSRVHRPARISTGGPHGRREPVARRRRLRVDPARHRDADRRGVVARRALPPRPSRAARPVVDGEYFRRRGSQPRVADPHRAQPQHRQPPARRLRGGGHARQPRLPGATRWWCSAATRSSTRRTRCRRASCRSRSSSVRRGWPARLITRIPMSPSSSTSSASATRATSSTRRGELNFGVGWWF